MSCDHQLIATHVNDLIEGKLAPMLQKGCAEALQNCAHCRNVHAQALMLYQFAHRWQDQPVPHWSRARHAMMPPRANPGRWQGWAALAASLAAVCLVLFQAEVDTSEGLYISFGGTRTEARIQERVAEELAAYTTVQDQLLAARLDEFAARQADTNALQFAQFQENVRGERRDELNYLLTGWQTQRYQDQQNLNQQITELASGQLEQNQYLNALIQSVAFTGGN